MTNPGDPIEDIKNKLDLKDVIAEYIRLEKAGTNYKAACPFHKEKTPSFFVSPARQLWRCFGCGEGGDMFTFVQNIEGVGFPEALRSLANKAGVEIKRQDPRVRSEKNKSLEICNLAAKYFQHQLESKNGKLVLEYLKERGLSAQSISDFKLGYAPRNSKNFIKFLTDKGFTLQDMEKAGVVLKLEGSGEYIGRFRGRIMFPIFDTAGNPVGFGGRCITEDLAEKMGVKIKPDLAKYINSPQTNVYDKSRVLYGLSDAKLDIRREDYCVVVEGYTDVILAHQNGYKNVVASSGTALTEEQLNLIKRFTNNLYTSFDMDAAGDTATRRGINIAQQHGFNIKVIILPEDKDPADIFAEGDAEEWKRAVEGARSIMQFYFDSVFKKFDATSAEGKRDIGKELAPILKSISNRIEQAHWVKELASRLGADIDDVWEDVKNAAVQTVEDNAKSGAGSLDEQAAALKQSYAGTSNRKELLARQIMIHIVKDPKLADTVKEELSNVKYDVPILNILKNVKASEQSEKAFSNLKQEDMDIIEHIKFELEVTPHEWSENSLQAALIDFKKTMLEEEKRELQLKIEESEKQEDDELTKKYLEEFHAKSSQLAELG